MSPTLGHSIAMALVKGGLSRMGEKVYISQGGPNGPVVHTATIASPVFLDPKAERQNA